MHMMEEDTMISVSELKIPQNNAIYDFNIPKGEIFGIVGGPQSGKTTLLKLLSGHKKPSSGRVQILGKPGFLFEDAFSYQRLTVGEHFRFFSSLHALAASEYENLKNELLLSDIWTAKANTLSESDMRRLNLAILLMSHPDIIFLDEPFFGIDNTSVFAMKEILQSFIDNDKTIVLSTFGQDTSIRFCDRLLYIETGLIEGQNADESIQTPPEKIFARIAVSKDNAVVLLRPEEILFVQASDGSALVTTAEDVYDARCTLTLMEEKLIHGRFFRSHRSTLVNLDDIQSIVPFSKDAFELSMRSTHQRVPLSKHRVDELRSLLHL